MGVAVLVDNVAGWPEIAAAGDVDQPRGIAGHGPFTHLDRAVLPPGLVKRHPDDDARMGVELGDHRVELVHELLTGRHGPLDVGGVWIEPRPGRIREARHMVLPEQHADLIAVGVEPPRLHLDVLADHVEAGGLEIVDVPPHCLVGGRRQQAIGPPALVERAKVEDRLAIEGKPPVAVGIFDAADFSDAEVARHAVAADAKLEVVERRGVGAPELGVGDAQRDRVAGGGDFGRGHSLAAERGDQLTLLLRSDDVEPEGDGAVAAGLHENVTQVGFGHLLEPDGSVDA